MSTTAGMSDGHDSLLKHIASMCHLVDLALEHLAAPPHATTILSSLASLQILHVTASTTVTYDFQPCTQLTWLMFSHTSKQRAVILLPTSAMGGDASLADLTLPSICNVHNLGFAMQLTYLCMSTASLQHSIVDWPYSLPSLAEFDCSYLGEFSDLGNVVLGEDEVNTLPAE